MNGSLGGPSDEEDGAITWCDPVLWAKIKDLANIRTDQGGGKAIMLAIVAHSFHAVHGVKGGTRKLACVCTHKVES